MNDNTTIMEFANREVFRKWLQKHHDTSEGFWILFKKGDKAFTANDALEEAICFGWIDGVMKSIDEKTYKKYFSRRKNKENWSEKNKKIFNKLKAENLITQAGIEAFRGNVDEGDKNDKDTKHKMNLGILVDVLKDDGDVLKLFEASPPSRQKQLAGFYCDAKSEETRSKRKQKIIEALITNNKGMLY